MFYNALYMLPIWEDSPNRMMMIYTIGSLCYLLLHGLLFSSLSEKMEMIQKYKIFIYPVFVGDLLLLYMNEHKKMKPKILLKENETPKIEEITPEQEQTQNCDGDKCIKPPSETTTDEIPIYVPPD